MSLESANATKETARNVESNNIIESDAGKNSVTAVDGNDTVQATPVQKEIETFTTTTTISIGDVDVEAAKDHQMDLDAREKTPSSRNNTSNGAAAVDGENIGDATTNKTDATTTKTTAAAAAATTITPSKLLPMKQNQDRSMVMDGDGSIAGSNKNNAGKMETDASLINFKVLYVLAQLCGITMIILVGSYIGVHAGGFAGTSQPSLEFNWHPFLMTIGLIFLYGNSILIYRGFRTTRKKTLKITHAAIHMGAFILTVIALQTVFDSHNLAAKPIPNMYSLHSWLGLSAVLIFCMQYVAGFMAYMVPGLREQYKIAYMPLHIYFGLFGFGLAIASALMGFTEKAIFSISNYSSLPNAGVMINICGVSFVIFGGLVLYLATEPSYKRRPMPEDAVLLTGANE